MIELPEAATLARQLNESVTGRRIVRAEAGRSPHKFAWYTGDPAGYGSLLGGRGLRGARASGGIVEIAMDGDMTLFFSDGVNLRLHKAGAKRPEKHQLILELDDGSALTASVQMYGGLNCYPESALDNGYVTGSRSKPSPLGDAFDRAHFNGLAAEGVSRALCAKAFLATEQRVPGLGNGVLQDILFNAGLNPRRKMDTLGSDEIGRLYDAVKSTLRDMTDKGGRDTEADLYGMTGGYGTILSRNTVGTACPRCGGEIVKEAFMGGSVYYCKGCQTK